MAHNVQVRRSVHMRTIIIYLLIHFAHISWLRFCRNCCSSDTSELFFSPLMTAGCNVFSSSKKVRRTGGKNEGAGLDVSAQPEIISFMPLI